MPTMKNLSSASNRLYRYIVGGRIYIQHGTKGLTKNIYLTDHGKLDVTELDAFNFENKAECK